MLVKKRHCWLLTQSAKPFLSLNRSGVLEFFKTQFYNTNIWYQLGKNGLGGVDRNVLLSTSAVIGITYVQLRRMEAAHNASIYTIPAWFVVSIKSNENRQWLQRDVPLKKHFSVLEISRVKSCWEKAPLLCCIAGYFSPPMGLWAELMINATAWGEHAFFIFPCNTVNLGVERFSELSFLCFSDPN